MGKQQTIIIDRATGVPSATGQRLVRSFLDRHGAGLDDLLRRFPALPGAAFRQAFEQHLKPGSASMELALALEEAVDTLLSLQGEVITPLPVDAGRRLNVDVGLRWYAARLHDLSKAVRTM